jgi:hypothetical protein
MIYELSYTRGLMAIIQESISSTNDGATTNWLSPNNEGMPFRYDIKNAWEYIVFK